jgi:hypothetical protein
MKPHSRRYMTGVWLTFVGVGSGFLVVVVGVGTGFVLDFGGSGFFVVVVGVAVGFVLVVGTSGFLVVVVVTLLVVGCGTPDVGRLILSVQRPPMHVMMYV